MVAWFLVYSLGFRPRRVNASNESLNRLGRSVPAAAAACRPDETRGMQPLLSARAIAATRDDAL